MKLYRNLIIIVAVLAVLCVGLFAISRYNPGENPNPVETEQPSSDMVNVYKANKDDVTKIHIKNTQEEYTLVRSGNTWLYNGDASIRIQQTAADSVAFSCTSVSVKQAVSEDEAVSANFGFDAPIGFAELTFKDGSTKKITVGGLSLDKENYYIMVSGDPKIYLKNSYGTESMIPKSIELRDMVLMTIDTENLGDLRHFHMQKSGNTGIKTEYTNTGTEVEPKMQWRMMEPVYAQMNGQTFVDRIAGKLESFTAVAVIEDHPKNLSVYGLDKPYASFSVGTTEETRSFIIGNETENYRYIKEDGYSTVYIVKKADLAFLDTSYVDLMSNLIHVEYITTIDRVEVISSDKTYQMKIEGSEGSETYSINGTKLPKEEFSRAYQAVIGISLESLDFSEEPNISPEAKILYHKKDGSVVTVAFLPVNERAYRVTVDGHGNSITNKKNFTNVLDKLESTIAKAK